MRSRAVEEESQETKRARFSVSGVAFRIWLGPGFMLAEFGLRATGANVINMVATVRE